MIDFWVALLHLPSGKLNPPATAGGTDLTPSRVVSRGAVAAFF